MHTRTLALLACLVMLAPSARTLAATDLERRAAERRAIEAVIWSVPAVNFELMYDALLKAGGDWNQVVYWSGLPDWKNQTLTPNPDVIYLIPFYDTRKGPVVLEVPPAVGGSITGSVDEAWQTAVEDVGPAGVDKGQGGKYLIVPPDFSGEVPVGYIRMPSSTYTGYALLRSNIGSGSAADIRKAVDYGRKVRVYPLAQASNPTSTKFIDAANVMFDSTIRYDDSYFEKLHRFVQREPWLERDRVMIDLLRSIGIEKGRPFAPDESMRATLKRAAVEAREWLEARYVAAFTPPYFTNGSRWGVPVDHTLLEGLGNNFAARDVYPIDSRAVMYSFGFFSAKHLGQGQFYLMSMQDDTGRALDGGRTYRLTVPPKAPVTLYWSATAYDRETHALIRDQTRSSRASNSQGLQKNPDGSIDVFFGPKAPDGKASNWVPTSAGRQFEVLFRLYGPEKPLFDKTWQLPDIVEVR